MLEKNISNVWVPNNPVPTELRLIAYYIQSMNTKKQQPLFPDHEPDISYEPIRDPDYALDEYLHYCELIFQQKIADGNNPWLGKDDIYLEFDGECNDGEV